ncbi:hypothetical protein [Mucilaginibacter sp. CSA2-8R]|uniref:hypothetical protein n=1 Tax=Mucilaginibacter sp. CSA2-8R TaxID=3141542 RepID=UPI00315D7FA6
MNFLSHFYFDRHTTDCYHVLGTVLPDLLKNADKHIIVHPEKLDYPAGPEQAIQQGWLKHLDVDRHFHNADFFKTNSHQLKLTLLPGMTGSPVKPFFLGHIALELLLDNLLLTTGMVKVDDFYAHLNSCDQEVIYSFLSRSGMQNIDVFLRFFENFKSSEYLHTYAETEKVTYALKRICMRIWNNPFSQENEEAMSAAINRYRNTLENNFTSIFDDIEAMLDD